MLFVSLQKKHFEQVLDISNKTLGQDYLTTDILTAYLLSNNYYPFVIELNDKVVGFTSLVILSPSELKQAILTENEWFYELTKAYEKIVLRKQTIVAPKFINKGYGNMLVQLSTKEVEKVSDFQLSTVWKKEGDKAMSNLLTKNGFSLIKTIKNYWEKDSIEHNYNCLICGNPPCKCATEVYIKKNASE